MPRVNWDNLFWDLAKGLTPGTRDEFFGDSYGEPDTFMSDRTVYWVLKEGTVTCSFEYDPALIAGLGATIPGHLKKWNKDNRTWSFNQLIWDRVCSIFELHGYIVPDQPADLSARLDAALSSGAGVSTGPYAVLFVVDHAPQAVINAAHRALANIYHPDLPSGDARKMSEINNARDEIKQLRETKVEA